MQNKFRKMNDKAKYHLDQLLMEMHITSYAEGFEAGKVVMETWSNNNPALSKTPNQQRAELIEEAKKFVEGLKGEHSGTDKKGNYVSDKNCYRTPIFVEDGRKKVGHCNAEFIRKGNRVTCLLRGTITNKVYATGRSNCNPNDVFNLYIGQAISLARALKIDVPVEFLEAVQPSEVVVGAVVLRKGEHFDSNGLRTITKKVGNDAFKTIESDWFTTTEYIVRITEDTNAQYEVTP